MKNIEDTANLIIETILADEELAIDFDSLLTGRSLNIEVDLAIWLNLNPKLNHLLDIHDDKKLAKFILVAAIQNKRGTNK